jgi:uncharacterized protein YpmS
MNTVLNNINQLVIVAIIALAIISAVIFVLATKHQTTGFTTITPEQMTQITVVVQEDETNRLMDRYAISYENHQYVWGAKSFSTLEDAINTAEAFIDKISVDFRLPIQAF